MRGTKKKWQRSNFFILDAVEYRPEGHVVWVRFRNQETGEIAAGVLWRERPGQPDWSKVCIDPATRSALLVPTLPGHPTTEGGVAEIPSDVIRAALDEDFRDYLADRAAEWSKSVGQQVAALRKSRGLTQQALARAAGLDEEVVAGIESGRDETSLAMVAKVVTAMGARLEDLAFTEAN